MKRVKKIFKNKIRRAQRVRAHIGKGDEKKLRFSIFRSNMHIYAQLINDKIGKTIFSASSHEIKSKKQKKLDIAREVGKLIAEKAKNGGFSKVIFDRGQYKYHGRVKALAESARENGLQF